jgi:molybdopterin synthase sulfur carrier subunit
MVKVFIPPLLRDVTVNRDLVEVSGATVREIVAALEAQYPGVRDRLCIADSLRPGLSVAVNGVVSSLGLLQKVPDGSEVHFLPAVGGG